MATDSLDDCGIYVGTTTGRLFHSRNNGDNWELLMEDLLPILSIECGVARNLLVNFEGVKIFQVKTGTH